MSLTREKVLQAALALVDEGGLKALSMRKLGQQVGVEAMSLYHHVSGKEDVLDGLVDLVIAEVELPGPTDGWREGMRRRAVSMRAMFRRHPWALSVLETRLNPGPALLSHHDAVLGCLRRDGFDVAGAGHAFALLDAFLYGFAMQEATLPFDTGEEAAEVASALVSQVPEGMFPHLVELTVERVMKPGYSFGAEFDFGLELILDGLERARVA